MTDDKATTVGREHKDEQGQWKDVDLMKRTSGLGISHTTSGWCTVYGTAMSLRRGKGRLIEGEYDYEWDATGRGK